MKSISIATAHRNDVTAIEAVSSSRRAVRPMRHRRSDACSASSSQAESLKREISELVEERTHLERIIEELERRNMELEAQIARQW